MFLIWIGLLSLRLASGAQGTPSPIINEECHCMSEWTSEEDGRKCAEETQNGCSTRVCDDDPRPWCMSANAPCKNEEQSEGGGWHYCAADACTTEMEECSKYWECDCAKNMKFDDKNCARDFKEDFGFEFNAETCDSERSCLQAAEEAKAWNDKMPENTIKDLLDCLPEEACPKYMISSAHIKARKITGHKKLRAPKCKAEMATCSEYWECDCAQNMKFDQICETNFSKEFGLEFNAETCDSKRSCLEAANKVIPDHDGELKQVMQDVLDCLPGGVDDLLCDCAEFCEGTGSKYWQAKMHRSGKKLRCTCFGGVLIKVKDIGKRNYSSVIGGLGLKNHALIVAKQNSRK